MSATRLVLCIAVLIVPVMGPVDPVASQPADLVSQARQALDARRFDEAIALLERVVSADAKNPAAPEAGTIARGLRGL